MRAASVDPNEGEEVFIMNRIVGRALASFALLAGLVAVPTVASAAPRHVGPAHVVHIEPVRVIYYTPRVYVRYEPGRAWVREHARECERAYYFGAGPRQLAAMGCYVR
jgi:hypothetical protein